MKLSHNFTKLHFPFLTDKPKTKMEELERDLFLYQYSLLQLMQQSPCVQCARQRLISPIVTPLSLLPSVSADIPPVPGLPPIAPIGTLSTLNAPLLLQVLKRHQDEMLRKQALQKTEQTEKRDDSTSSSSFPISEDQKFREVVMTNEASRHDDCVERNDTENVVPNKKRRRRRRQYPRRRSQIYV